MIKYKKAYIEYDKYKEKQDYVLSPVEEHFLEILEQLDKLEGK